MNILILKVVAVIAIASSSAGIGATPGLAAGATSPSRVTAASQNPTLRQGDSGAAVVRLQRRLVELRYWIDEVDGNFGPLTAQAVMAFQKINRLPADTVVGSATWKALAAPVRPKARTSRGLVVEIDRSRQVLLRVRDGRVGRIFNTSTGRTGMATPLGRFRVFRHIDGWRYAPLGALYRPKYFNEGIAIHGAHKIPNYPASHGCARVSLAAMDWLFPRVPIGTRVWVY